MPRRLYSWSRPMPECFPGTGGGSCAVLAITRRPGFSLTETVTIIGINMQDLSHFGFEFGTAPFQIVLHLLRKKRL